MPFSYVPSTRTLRIAWSLVVTLATAVVGGLIYVSTSTALDLQATNDRLHKADVEKAALIHRMETQGFALTFVKGDHHSSVYVCRLTRGKNGYTCRAR